MNKAISQWYQRAIGSAITDFIIDDTNPSSVYIGFAKTGSTTSASAWLIVRTKRLANGTTAVRVAEQSYEFDQIFDLRASLDYVEA